MDRSRSRSFLKRQKDRDRTGLSITTFLEHIAILDTELQDRILNADKYNFDVLKAMDILKNDGMNGLWKDLEDWTITEKDGKRMLFYQGRNYVPKDDDL